MSEKIIYVCDLCKREFNDKVLYESSLGEVCNECGDNVNKLYEVAYENLKKRNEFIITNRVGILNLLERINESLWEKLFGADSLVLVKQVIGDLKNEDKMN